MTDVIYPSKFKDRMKALFRPRLPNEPEITLNTAQILTLFNNSTTFDELRKYRPDSNMVELFVHYDTHNRLQSITFRLYHAGEREQREAEKE